MRGEVCLLSMPLQHPSSSPLLPVASSKGTSVQSLLPDALGLYKANSILFLCASIERLLYPARLHEMFPWC
jgi:hypothetical protein